jgi:hypothetical protein
MEAENPAPSGGGCESFCELANSLCKDRFAIYHGNQDCPTACALYTAEERECRRGELKKLQDSSPNEAYLYCPRASLSGGNGVCGGSPCKNYCKTMSIVCADYPEDSVNYPDAEGKNAEECEAKCSVIPDQEKLPQGADDSTFDINADHEGDTIQCRLVHLTLATQSKAFASDHCAHAYISPQPMSGRTPWCGAPLETDGVPTCEDYCAVNLAACKDEHKVYDNPAQCRAACRAFEPGNLSENSQEPTLACRKYHSYNAAVYADPEKHCPHAGPGGADVCGDDCESLCLLLENGCPAEFEAEYDGSANSCQRACDTARKADPKYKGGASYSIASAKRGDPFACRLYSATVATAMSNDAADVCAVAVGKAACPFPEDK